MAAELTCGELPGIVSAALADEPGPRAEFGRPRRDVRRLTAGADPDLGALVGTGDERPGRPHDHVEQQVAERGHAHGRTLVVWQATFAQASGSVLRPWARADVMANYAYRRRRLAIVEGERQRGPFRSFVLGGLVGAAGAIAAARRLKSPSRRPRDAPAGLAAFEDAPCFLEVVEQEAQSARERGGEARTERPAE